MGATTIAAPTLAELGHAARSPSLGRRSGLLDLVRVLAGLDIVAYHTGSVLGNKDAVRLGFGITVFLLVSALSVGRFPGERSFRALARERATRYLEPFLFWCAVYTVLQVAQAVDDGRPLLGWFEPCMLWRGTWYHLWYMPVSLAMVLGVEAARRATMQLPAAIVIGGCVALSLVLVYADPAWIRPHASHCWYAWVWAGPTIPLGLAFGRLLAVDRAPRRRWHLLPVAAAFAAVSLAIWLAMESRLALRFAEGALLIAIGFALPGPSGAWSRRLLTLSIGIFLCHPLVLRLVLPFVRELPPIAVVPIVWGLSALLAFGLQQTPLARFAGERAPALRLAGLPAAGGG